MKPQARERLRLVEAIESGCEREEAGSLELLESNLQLLAPEGNGPLEVVEGVQDGSVLTVLLAGTEVRHELSRVVACLADVTYPRVRAPFPFLHVCLPRTELRWLKKQELPTEFVPFAQWAVNVRVGVQCGHDDSFYHISLRKGYVCR